MSDTNCPTATLHLRVNELVKLKNKLEDKIDEKLEKVDYDESKLGTNQGAVTRWRKRITETKKDISETRKEIEKLQQLKTDNSESATQAQSVATTPSISKELKRLQHDFTTQPRFTPQLDVAVFTRSMQVLYDTHVKCNLSLESDFVKQVEVHIDTSYRIQLQRYVETNGRFSTWKSLKEYLVNTHRSMSTLFMELGKFTNLPMRNHESVRDFCQRLKTAADEAQTIIMSKLKEALKAEPSVQDIFELMQMDSCVRAMQSHPRYREHYNMIVHTIDDCVNLDMLSQKASKIADRSVDIDPMSEPSAYLTTKSDSKPSSDSMVAMEKKMEKMMALIAQGQNQNTSSSSMSSGKPKPSKGRKPNNWSNPEFRARVADEKCRLYQKKNECNRSNCPYFPCNKKSTSNTFYSKDF